MFIAQKAEILLLKLASVSTKRSTVWVLQQFQYNHTIEEKLYLFNQNNSLTIELLQYTQVYNEIGLKASTFLNCYFTRFYSL